MGGITKNNEEEKAVKAKTSSSTKKQVSTGSTSESKDSEKLKTSSSTKKQVTTGSTSASKSSATTAKKTSTAEKSDSTKAKTSASKASSAAATKKTASKKPEAGIDENGTFRAWGNAKTKADSKKAKTEQPDLFAPKTSSEEAEKKLAAAKAIDPNAKANEKKLADYGDDQVKHLDALEHIRLRSGMYIGRLGDGSNQNDGIYVLVKEVIDNSIDEFIVGFGNRIDIEIKDNRVKVRDYGRGIPLGKVVDCVSQINTGAKYNDDVFQFSVGMNGVGTKAVNALSSYFRVISIRDGKCVEAVFEQGKLKSNKAGSTKPGTKNGTYFEFIPDETIFGKYSFNMEYVEKRMWNYAYLNTGLTIFFNGQEYTSQNGLLDLLNAEIADSSIYQIGNYRGEHLQFAFTHNSDFQENYFSFVNGQFTSDGGTHLNAFKEGFVRGINDFFQTSFKAEDVRAGITAAVLVKIKDPLFESQTKNKLGNTDIRQWIVAETQSGLDDWLHKNPKEAQIILEKIKKNEKFRTDLASVKKEAKEAAKKTAVNIAKLKDCKFHLNDGAKNSRGNESMIFITEGNSASGNINKTRDVSYQAVFSLRGKPENMYGKKPSEIYKNDELYQLMSALGIEESIEGLRYSKIVIATDADNDGFHIRNLVLTFLLGFYEELITSGRVFILETPLFRVRNKKENIYCYSEKERDDAQKLLGKSAETTRFKGLGEINDDEFGQFIEPETIKLTPVEIQALKNIPPLLAFYMGKNTPERRDFIVNNLLEEIDA